MHGGRLVLVTKGRPVVEIRVQEGASPTVQFAAQEFQRYVKQMCGAEIPVVAGKLPEHSLHVGKRGSVPAGSSQRAIEGDGYALLPVGGGLMLRANRPRGVLFAVYDLLIGLGCRWFEPGTEGEVVPRLSDPALALEERVESPRFALSGFVHGDTPEIVDWLAKNRMNATILYGTRLEQIRASGALEALQLRDMSVEFGHHDFKRYFIDPASYFEGHPEWFGMRGGRRVGGYRGVCLCLTNREMEEEFARNVEKLLEELPWIERLSVWPDDGMQPCECEECRRDWSDGRNVSDHVLGFVNRIAERFPEKRVSHLVYQATLRSFPRQERPLPNVDFCTIEVNPARLRAWRRLLDHDQPGGTHSGRLQFIYGYWGGHSGSVSQTRHFPSELSDLLDDFEEAGVDGMLTQAQFICPSAYVTNLLAMARMGWRNRPSAEEVIRDYCRTGYAEFAGLFEEYFGAIDGLHGSIFRTVCPGYSLSRRFQEATNNERAILLATLRKLVKTYERFRARMLAIPADPAGQAGLPRRVLQERRLFEYNERAVIAYYQAFRAVESLCSAREAGQEENRAVFVELAREADQGLDLASRSLQELQRVRGEVLGDSGTSGVLIDMQILDVEALRHDESLIKAGLAVRKSLRAAEVKVATASSPDYSEQPLVRDAVGMQNASTQLVFRPGKGEAFIELELPVEKDGNHTLLFCALREADMGKWRASVGSEASGVFDLYYPDFRVGSYCMGSFDLEAPSCRLRFERVPAKAAGADEGPIDPLAGGGSEAESAARGEGWLALDTITMIRHETPRK